MTNTNTNPDAIHVERIERPSPEFFHQHFVSGSRPVIITGAMNQWSALSLWTLDYLKATVGEVIVRGRGLSERPVSYDAEAEEGRIASQV